MPFGTLSGSLPSWTPCSTIFIRFFVCLWCTGWCAFLLVLVLESKPIVQFYHCFSMIFLILRASYHCKIWLSSRISLHLARSPSSPIRYWRLPRALSISQKFVLTWPCLHSPPFASDWRLRQPALEILRYSIFSLICFLSKVTVSLEILK